MLSNLFDRKLRAMRYSFAEVGWWIGWLGVPTAFGGAIYLDINPGGNWLFFIGMGMMVVGAVSSLLIAPEPVYVFTDKLRIVKGKP